MKKEFKSNILFSGTNFFLRAINNLLIFAILARILEVGSFGDLSYLLAIVMIGTKVVDFGYRLQVIRDVSQNSEALNLNYYWSRTKIKLGIGVFVCVFLILIIYLRADIYDPWPTYAFISILLSFSFSFSNLNYAFFEGIQKFHLQTFCLILTTVGSLLGVYICYKSGSILNFLWIYSLVSFLTFIFGFYLFLKLRVKSSLPGKFFLRKEMLVVLPFALITAAEIFFGQIDVLIFENYASREQLGYYLGIKRILIGLSIISLVISTAYLPILTKEIHFKKSISFIKVFLNTLIIGVVVSVIYFLFDDILIKLFLGNKYKFIRQFNLEIALIIISKFLLIIPAVYLVASNFEITRAKIIIFILLMSIILHLLFIPKYEIQGALYIVVLTNMLLGLSYLVFLKYNGTFKKLASSDEL